MPLLVRVVGDGLCSSQSLFRYYQQLPVCQASCSGLTRTPSPIVELGPEPDGKVCRLQRFKLVRPRPEGYGSSVSDLTQLLERAGQGDPRAGNELLPLVYDELRKLAAQKMAGEHPGQTLQATALVHEAWLRLGGDRQASWENRAHFFAAAAEAMRRILIDRARAKRSDRRGGGAGRVELDAAHFELAAGMDDDGLLAVHEALDRLAAADEVKADLVKLRFFAGLTIVEAARVLGLSEITAKRHWAFARAWLYREITRERSD